MLAHKHRTMGALAEDRSGTFGAATAQKFATRLGATAVAKYDDMVGRVDGVIFGGYWEDPWHHLLARPYLEAKHSTAIMATAKHEHYNEVPALRSRIKNVGQIQCVQATCNSTDFPMHLHTQFMLMGILGYDVEKVSLITDSVTRNNFMRHR